MGIPFDQTHLKWPSCKHLLSVTKPWRMLQMHQTRALGPENKMKEGRKYFAGKLVQCCLQVKNSLIQKIRHNVNWIPSETFPAEQAAKNLPVTLQEGFRFSWPGKDCMLVHDSNSTLYCKCVFLWVQSLFGGPLQPSGKRIKVRAAADSPGSFLKGWRKFPHRVMPALKPEPF